MQEKDVFQFYQDLIKPLYSEIEAEGNQIPVELLFEIHAAFDHLKRLHIDGSDVNVCCEKAMSHLKRGALDVLKLKLKYFNRDTEKLLECEKGLDLVDNGEFLSSLLADKSDIQQRARKARLTESNGNPATAFDAWLETSLKIDDFRDKYFIHHAKVAWANKKAFTWINKDSIRGAIIGLITGIVSSAIVWYLTTPKLP